MSRRRRPECTLGIGALAEGAPCCAVVTGRVDDRDVEAVGRKCERHGARDAAYTAGVALDGLRPDPVPAQMVADEVRSAGGAAEAFGVDCRSPAAARELVGRVADWSSARPLVLVHAAGTLRDGLLHTTSDDDWDEVLGAQLHARVQLTRALVPAMREARWGRIV